MTILKRSGLGLAALCALAWGGQACAQNSGLGERLRETFTRLDSNGDMVVERSEVPEDALPAFHRLLKRGDADKDGKLSFEEVRGLLAKAQAAAPAAARAGAGAGMVAGRLKAMDKNGDGKVAKGEFEGRAELFGRLDADKDGTISAAEFPKAARTPNASTGPEARLRRVRAMDKDGDGKVSQDEFTGAPEMFDRLDKNQDRVIDKNDQPSPP